jgi:ssDNA-binding Zn-finger/Zn-ribbon topoisomerase 1
MENKAFKRCPKCGKTLLLTEFYNNRANRDGRDSHCKKCKREAYAERIGRIPQPGIKATLCLADFEDPQLFAELRRRGYSGELKFYKTVAV